MIKKSLNILYFSFIFCCSLVASADNVSAAEWEISFSRDVLPILSENCLHCHGPDAKQRQADLRLDDEASAKQLRDGRFVVSPGNATNSLLIERIISSDADIRMPPKETNRTLSPEQIAILRSWIDGGAAWGKHWAFDRLNWGNGGQLSVPRDLKWCTSPIDVYILEGLYRQGIAPSHPVAREKLLRRVSLDLIGVPTTPAETDRFLANTSADAFDREVDRLLASPKFGERMIWEWLEAARYADTNGYQGDPTRAMWYWRDWAIAALNANLPYDEFTIQQLAGDLLPNPTREQLIATGFHRNHMINGEGGRIAEESRVEYVQDRVETTGTIWLGLTLVCARCHDHKYDSISQREYYSLAAYFNSIEETGANDAGGLANPLISLANEDEQKKLQEYRLDEQKTREARDAAEKQLAGDPLSPKDVTQKDNVERARKRFDDAKKKREQAERNSPRTMVMRERSQPRDTFVLARGAYNKPLHQVEHGILSVLPALPVGASNNRLALARWIVAPDNPLMARVTVNRFWQMIFGSGLVKTPEDFGVQGERPTHPELLDWLAAEFSQPDSLHTDKWNVKRLLRQLVLSATYQQQSHVTPQLLDADPENRWFARGPRHRLPSWMLRDQSLFFGGILWSRIGGPPVKPYQPDGIWEEATFGKIRYDQDHGEALYRRSLYVFWRRIVGPTMFFDVSTRQTCQVKTARTNTPLHALVTLNDTTYVEASRMFAERVLTAGGSDDRSRIEYAFRVVTSRYPKEIEVEVLQLSLERLRSNYVRDPVAAEKLLRVGEAAANANVAAADLAAFTGLASLLFNLDETLSKE